MGKKKSVNELSRDLQLLRQDEMLRIKGGKKSRRKLRWLDISGRCGGILPQ